MKKQWIVAAGLLSAAGTAHGQVTLEPIATGYGGTDISGDGTVVVGNSTNDGIYETFRWTQATGVVRLGQSSGFYFGQGAGSPDVSYDGSRVSATIADSTLSFITPGVWEDGVGWSDCMPPLLPDSQLLDLAYGSAWGLSGDGETLSGFYWRVGGLGERAHVVNWSAGSGPTSLSAAGQWNSRGNAVNYDGSVTVGWEAAPNGRWRPHAWVNGVDYQLSGADTLSTAAEGVSGDGTVVVGTSDTGFSTREATMWTWNGAGFDEFVIGRLPGTPAGFNAFTYATEVTDDKRLVVGTNNFVDNGPFSTATGFMWTARTGMFDIVDYMADNGIALPIDTQIAHLPAVSADGSTILVIVQDLNNFFSYSTALLHIPTPCSDADLTTTGAPVGNTNYGMPDGQVTGADINYYVNAWIGGDLVTGDMTTTGAGIGDSGYGVPDGDVTGADIQYYVNLWIAGCP